MRLSSFRIKNYKSIKDTGEVTLSDNNNVFVLAGQNESGKSAVLLALSDFSNGEKNFDSESTQFSLGEEPKQYIECTYLVEDGDLFYDNIISQIISDYEIDIEDEEKEVIVSKLKSQKKFVLIKEMLDEGVRFYVCNDVYQRIKKLFTSKLETQEEESEEDNLEEVNFSDEDIAKIMFSYSPEITIFDDFCSLLPDRILLSDLQTKNENAGGYIAVKNLETILGIDFIEKEMQIDSKRSSLQDHDNTTLSIDFQKDWQQKIYNTNEVKLEYNFQKRNGEGQEGSFIEFYVITKNGEKLYPHQRSKGLMWFLSFWLELKARSLQENGTILLLDEPDQHLHIKAQEDMLKLINKLADEGNQILYSTHLPYLIDIDNLSAVRLVHNSEEKGTLIEKLSSVKINSENKVDALKPISDAIGMGSDYFINSKSNKCIILEGLSDFFYFSAMKELIDPKSSYVFLPATGIPKIPTLISFCLGYGKSWKVVTDDGIAAKNMLKAIAENFFDGNILDAKKRILVLSGTKGIENMFDYSDLKLVDPQIGKDKQDKVAVIGKKRKVLFSLMFYEKVKKGEITKEELSKDTIRRFQNAFVFIKKRLPTL